MVFNEALNFFICWQIAGFVRLEKHKTDEEMKTTYNFTIILVKRVKNCYVFKFCANQK